jgi:hypothetical protein
LIDIIIPSFSPILKNKHLSVSFQSTHDHPYNEIEPISLLIGNAIPIQLSGMGCWMERKQLFLQRC